MNRLTVVSSAVADLPSDFFAQVSEVCRSGVNVVEGSAALLKHVEGPNPGSSQLSRQAHGPIIVGGESHHGNQVAQGCIFRPQDTIIPIGKMQTSSLPLVNERVLKLNFSMPFYFTLFGSPNLGHKRTCISSRISSNSSVPPRPPKFLDAECGTP